jgi:chromosome segregation protein
MEKPPRARSPLKSLELQGYKTFASKTTFEFGQTVTAIVGPNGSGKSNIADAIRWVLGEQAYSLLRGKRTEDMIFAGSEARPRASMASATIAFDNSDGWLPIDFAEVSISRRAYRDGQNEYFLNGARVRLREVAELLANVGLAERTYTIIGQGLVDAALSLKAEERRRLFEEAAGIGLYRSRREEALKRLETTRRNLERVQDIVAELRPRLRSLERQAQRAREYDQVKTDLEASLRQWYGHHWHRMSRVVAEAREEAGRSTAKRDDVRAALESVESQLAAARQRIDRLRSELHERSRQVSGLFGERERLGTQLAVAQERLRWLGEEDSHNRAELASAEESRLQVLPRLEEARAAAEASREALARAEADQAAARDAGAGAQAGVSPIARLNIASRALEELAVRQASWRGLLVQAERRLQEARERRDAGESRRSEARQGEAEAERSLNEAAARQSGAERGRQEAAKAEDEARERLARLEAANGEAQARAHRLEAETGRLEARLEGLKRHEAEADELFAHLAQAAQDGRLASAARRLGEAIRVPPELEKAIAGALGDFGDGLALGTLDDVTAALALLDGEERVAAFVPLNGLRDPEPRLPADGPDLIGNAAALVEAEPEMRPIIEMLLGRTLVARDRGAARSALPRLPLDARVVTLAGEVFHPAGPVVAGSARRKGVRERSIGQVEAQVVQVQAALSAARTEQAEAFRSAETAKAAHLAARVALEKALDLERSAGSAHRDAEAAFEARRRARHELEASMPAFAQEAAQAEEELTRVEREGAAFPAERERLEGELRIAGETLKASESGEVAWWVAQAEARLEGAKKEFEGARTREAELTGQVGPLERQAAQRRSRLEAIQAERSKLEAEVAQSGQALRAIEGRLAEVRSGNEPAEKAIAESEQQRAELEAAESRARSEMQEAEQGHSQAQIELARRQEEMNSLRRRIEDDFGLVAFDFDETTTGQSPLPLEGLVERLPVVESLPLEVETQVERLRAQLRRMGAVNPEAQREYLEVKERVEFLTTQVDDLRRAESQLQEVIAELDLLMEREFRKTFDAVAGEFRDTFTSLFGGGSARLRLTDPEDMTLTGIDIEARLPGRREQGLSMLSGGERSLTACALIFALLRVSPTPFCVLDEVDAMLDEANVQRFRLMLKDLSQHTQFLVITHNRETVQAAEVVYGVTMGRDSASTVISLRLDEAEEQLRTRG